MTNDAGSTITAFIICHNEASQIRRCLESISWCDEIVVVDSGSTDQTLEICREFTDKIFHREWSGYVSQKRFALEQCSSEWVFNIDADEEVSEQLREEMMELLRQDKRNPTVNGCYINRVVYYLGRWWDKGGWYPEYRLRLCRRSVTIWGGHDPHEKATVSGATTRLEGRLHHYTYTDLNDQITRLNRFALSAAKSLDTRGVKFSVSQLLFRPLFRFLKFYIFKKGYRDGLPGFIVAMLEAFYVFFKYIKLWELQKE